MRVLIIGRNSYIAQRLKKFLSLKGINVDMISVRDDAWKKESFSIFDAVIYCAGIVHSKGLIEQSLYRLVNVEIPFEMAQKSKDDGVKQFVYLSSMAVYGLDKRLPQEQVITVATECMPKSLYGKSKLEGERKLESLKSPAFTLTFVRPPNVYGHNCKGNYIRLFSKLSNMMLLIPILYTDVRQGMIFIDNLTELLYQLIKCKIGGVITPQDQKVLSSYELMCLMRSVNQRSLRTSKLLGNILKLFSKLSIMKKIYGGILYDEKLTSIPGIDYHVVGVDEGLNYTLRGDVNDV